MINPENTLLDYRKIESEARTRAKQVKLQYAARVPQASLSNFATKNCSNL